MFVRLSVLVDTIDFQDCVGLVRLNIDEVESGIWIVAGWPKL